MHNSRRVLVAGIPRANVIYIVERDAFADSRRIQDSVRTAGCGTNEPETQISISGNKKTMNMAKVRARTVVFTVVFLVIEAHGGRCFRTPCPNCRAEPLKCQRQRPDPAKKGRFRVASSSRHPSP